MSQRRKLARAQMRRPIDPPVGAAVKVVTETIDGKETEVVIIDETNALEPMNDRQRKFIAEKIQAMGGKVRFV
jgi:hypothetical protein